MKKVASILLGSGFSVPDGLPTVGQINDRMKSISKEEITVLGGMHAIFLNGQIDENKQLHGDETLFIQEFLRFYNEEVLGGETFHYETFYDFYSLYLRDGTNKELIEPFCNRFEKKYTSSDGTIDAYNRVRWFNRSFNQLLGGLLFKPAYIGSIGLFNYSPYEEFLKFLRDLLHTYDVKVHTLNHDLLFEYIGLNHTFFSGQFSDGFEVTGSPIYGLLSRNHEIDKVVLSNHYKVKVPYYTGKYDKPLTLYKLHGSIQNYIVHAPDQSTYRIKPDYGVDEFYLEVQDNKSGEWNEIGLHDELSPDFLSGTTNKTLYYDADPFYRNLFDHFHSNLENSDILVVIGYGFRDPGINAYLEQYYLSSGKLMFVIDPGQPDMSLIEKYGSRYIKMGVADIPYESFRQLLPQLEVG